MCRHLLLLAILAYPLKAESNEPAGDSLALEVGADFLQGNFTSNKEAGLSIVRYQPFFLLEYRLNRWVSNYTVIATEITAMGYSQLLNEQYTIRMDLSSSANVFLAQGLRLNFLEYRHFRLGAIAQYEFSLGSVGADIDSVTMIQKETRSDITDVAREHVRAEYSWQRLHLALIAQYDIWRFTPFLMFGLSMLEANIGFNYDSEAISTLALFGYKTSGEDRDRCRATALIGMAGTEFSIWRGLSANVAGAAVPESSGWIFAARVSVIWHVQ